MSATAVKTQTCVRAEKTFTLANLTASRQVKASEKMIRLFTIAARLSGAACTRLTDTQQSVVCRLPWLLRTHKLGSRRLSILQDVVQIVSGQGVPPSNDSMWARVYHAAGSEVLSQRTFLTDSTEWCIHKIILTVDTGTKRVARRIRRVGRRAICRGRNPQCKSGNSKVSLSIDSKLFLRF
jgi:hypothetical protein